MAILGGQSSPGSNRKNLFLISLPLFCSVVMETPSYCLGQFVVWNCFNKMHQKLLVRDSTPAEMC